MGERTIDVIIAARNERKYIARCIEALRKQNYPADALAIYVVDHGSTDDTAQIAERLDAHVVPADGKTIASVRNAGLRASKGELVAFLDAHCIADPGWAQAIDEEFVDEFVGGCQGTCVYVCEDSLVQSLMDVSMFRSDDEFYNNTIGAKYHAFPCITSANGIYSRTALEEVGGFDETLFRAEDIDLSWKVFLHGYKLTFAPAARVTHFDTNKWTRFPKRMMQYGIGAAQLAHVYGLEGPERRTGSLPVNSVPSIKLALTQALFKRGFDQETERLRNGSGSEFHKFQFGPVDERFRPWFDWAPTQELRISPGVVFWVSRGNNITIVRLKDRYRYILHGASADIFGGLMAGKSKSEILSEICARYLIPQSRAIEDISDFEQELLSEELIERRQ